MITTGTESRRSAPLMPDELVEVWRELGEVEHLAEDAAVEAPPPDSEDLELVAVLEQADAPLAPAPEPDRAPRAEPRSDVETYAIGPELEELADVAAYAPRDDEPDEPAEDAESTILLAVP